MAVKKCFIDFEYNRSKEAKLNVVSVAYSVEGKRKSFWLDGHAANQYKFKHDVLQLRDAGVIFVCYNALAEATSMFSLNLNPLKMKWIDLQQEFKMLCNHWDEFRYGKQYLKGKVVQTYSPALKKHLPAFRTAKMRFDNPQTSLAACTYKLLGETIDVEHKDAMRNLIISGGPFSNADKKKILDYGEGDIDDLPRILSAIVKNYKNSKVRITLDEMLYRGHCVAHTAIMQQRGYPVSKTVHNLAQAVPDMIREVQEDINAQFPEMKIFVWNKREKRYSRKAKPLEEWIRNNGLADKWERTGTGKLSLSLDAFTEHFECRSPYERGSVPAQMIRLFRFLQSLNGFKPKGATAKDKSTFFDVLGSDHRARPYLNPYGSQSARFQPSATGFIPLKSSWMRWFIQPKSSRACTSIDYESQEFLIAALLSGDDVMLESYASGDPYFDFAKKAGAVPSDAIRADHEEVRTMFKSTTLGIQYLMGHKSLAKKLTGDVGRYFSPEEAQDLISLFSRVYRTFDRFRQLTIKQYRCKRHLKLPDGWVMFGDNQNHRSVANCPIQGVGSCVLRSDIILCHERGLAPIMPLHDALTVEHKIDNTSAIDTFHDVMREGFVKWFDDKQAASLIRLEAKSWSKGYGATESIVTPRNIKVPTSRYWLEKRGMAEFDQMKKHFIVE